MKTTVNYILITLLAIFISGQVNAQQEKEVRIKLLKKHNGDTKVVDTIISIPGDSIVAFWATPGHERIKVNTDSIMRMVHKKMREINMDSVMREVEKKMKHVEVHMRKLNDSLLEHKMEITLPKLKKLDSLNKYQIKKSLQMIDSVQKKVWIMKLDSLNERSFNFDVDIDSIMNKGMKRMVMFNPDYFHHQLPDMNELRESLREGMKEAHFFIMDKDFDWEKGEDSELKYMDGKVIKVKTDPDGKVTKAIVMSPDGENIEVKEGLEAYKFVTEDGEEIIIVTKIELKNIKKEEREELEKKGVALEENRNRLEPEELKIFPNPHEGSFRLTFKLPQKGAAIIRIFDQQGNTVYSKELKNFQGSCDKEIALNPGLEEGIYFLQIQQNNKVITKKMLVN